MSESKRTPGPWEIAGPSQGNEVPVSYMGSDNRGTGASWICMCNANNSGVNEANAQLIAAAPDLLAACKASLDELISYEESACCEWGNGVPNETDAMKLVRAAIAKAEGR